MLSCGPTCPCNPGLLRKQHFFVENSLSNNFYGSGKKKSLSTVAPFPLLGASHQVSAGLFWFFPPALFGHAGLESTYIYIVTSTNQTLGPFFPSWRPFLNSDSSRKQSSGFTLCFTKGCCERLQLSKHTSLKNNVPYAPSRKL